MKILKPILTSIAVCILLFSCGNKNTSDNKPNTSTTETKKNFNQKKEPMNLFSIRIITNDVKKMAEFYEHITGIPKTQNIDAFAEIFTEKAILAIGSPNTLKAFDGVDDIVPEQNKTMILEFKVKDVDAEYERLKDFLQEKIVQKPKMMPWGNKSLLFKDPDGNLINYFTTVTPEAIKRWGE